MDFPANSDSKRERMMSPIWMAMDASKRDKRRAVGNHQGGGFFLKKKKAKID
jgi:hypothetical protein